MAMLTPQEVKASFEKWVQQVDTLEPVFNEDQELFHSRLRAHEKREHLLTTLSLMDKSWREFYNELESYDQRCRIFKEFVLTGLKLVQKLDVQGAVDGWKDLAYRKWLSAPNAFLTTTELGAQAIEMFLLQWSYELNIPVLPGIVPWATTGCQEMLHFFPADSSWNLFGYHLLYGANYC